MIEDDIYRTSSQFRLWSYTEASLKATRDKTNETACERVRAAQRQARSAQASATPSAAGTPQPGSDGETRKPEEKEIECLTPEEELIFVRYYCEQALDLGDTYKPPLPTMVRVSRSANNPLHYCPCLTIPIYKQATAIQYLRRFYLTNSPMNYHPKSLMACALFLATKTDNYYLSLRQFAEGYPVATTAEEVIAPEFQLMQGLRFTFDVRHPFRGLEGGVMELSAIAQGQAAPAPHIPSQTPQQLQQQIRSLAPPPVHCSSISDRIARAHGTTRETLKSAAQMTDAYFFYTPSQIWLSAFLLADRPLAEFYLDTKLGGPLTQTTDTAQSDLQNPLYELRTKLLKVLNECSALLQSYTPLNSDPEQMKQLKQIARKQYRCLNPGGKAAKRDPAQPAAAVATESAQVSESETERLAKKRKLEQEQKSKSSASDMFGPELVPDRTKQ